MGSDFLNWERGLALAKKSIFSKEKKLPFGNIFLDDAFRGGISKSDLCVIGAPTGGGKTQFAMNMARVNAQQGKRVCYIALEATDGEIEERIIWPTVQTLYKHKTGKSLTSFEDFHGGTIKAEVDLVWKEAVKLYAKEFGTVRVFYKTEEDFDEVEMIKQIISASILKADLLIIDHLHFFDYSDNEAESIKSILKKCSHYAQKLEMPIVMLAHLRKKNPQVKELVAGNDEFHGSSNITKIASKVITFGSGKYYEAEGAPKSETFFRVCKSRFSSDVLPFVGRMVFDYRSQIFDGGYHVGKANGNKFNYIPNEEVPRWATNAKKINEEETSQSTAVQIRKPYKE